MNIHLSSVKCFKLLYSSSSFFLYVLLVLLFFWMCPSVCLFSVGQMEKRERIIKLTSNDTGHLYQLNYPHDMPENVDFTQHLVAPFGHNILLELYDVEFAENGCPDNNIIEVCSSSPFVRRSCSEFKCEWLVFALESLLYEFVRERWVHVMQVGFACCYSKYTIYMLVFKNLIDNGCCPGGSEWIVWVAKVG